MVDMEWSTYHNDHIFRDGMTGVVIEEVLDKERGIQCKGELTSATHKSHGRGYGRQPPLSDDFPPPLR